MESDNPNLVTGYIVRLIPQKSFGFIRVQHCQSLQSNDNQENIEFCDYHFNFSNLNGYGGILDPKKDDKLVFLPKDGSNKSEEKKPFAYKPTLVSLSRRNALEWQKALNRCLELLHGASADESDELAEKNEEALVVAVRCQAVWQELTAREVDLETARSLCKLSLGLNRPPLRRRGLLPNFLDRCLSAGGSQAPAEFFTPLFDSAAKGDADDRRLMLAYLLLCLDSARSCSVPAMLRLIEPLVVGLGDDDQPAAMTGQSLLLELLRLSVAPEGSEQLRLPWRRLPVVPTAFEMEGRGSAIAEFLLPVRARGAYDNIEDYCNTYFRLFRADCFDRVVKGTRAWQRGELDQRDMSVYTDVRLCGVRLSSSCRGSWPMTLGLRFRLGNGDRVDRWDRSSKLLPGNLLCISPDGDFDASRLLWATVAFRDSKQLQRESVVWIELCSDCNSVSDVHAFQSMLARQTSGMLMAESPTLFKACEPVLRSLQQFQPNQLPFADILSSVKVNRARDLPDYVARYYAAKSAPPRLPCLDMGQEVKLDPSQASAFANALHRRLAIIQGPPGTGKSFLGVLIVRQLTALPTFRPPALVLAYKNRALDDFLVDLLRHYPDEQLLRVGGRCSRKELDKISLGALLAAAEESGTAGEQLRQVSEEQERARSELQHLLARFNRVFSRQALLLAEHLTEDQLLHFLLSRQPVQRLKSLQAELQTCPGGRLQSHLIAQLSDESRCKLSPLASAFLEALKLWMPDASVTEKIFRPPPPQPPPSPPPHAAEAADDAEDSQTVLTDPKSKSQSQPKSQQRQPRKPRRRDAAESTSDDADADVALEQEERLAAFVDHAGNLEKDTVIRFGWDAQQQKPQQQQPQPQPQPQQFLAPFLASPDQLSPGSAATAARAVQLASVPDLWSLAGEERAVLLQLVLLQAAGDCMPQLQSAIDEFCSLAAMRRELRLRRTAALLSSKRIVGMTVTGASIQRDILRLVRPSLVVVEEAAEVGEPQLLACLSPSVQHLVLIGDHQQLRPPTESYRLARDFDLDVSMFERLINNGIPYDQLTLQNRMRPELAKFLHDIYPNLRDNNAVVDKHQPTPCVAKSAFFWDHTEPESGDRSFINREEAERCVALALFLISQGVSPARLTILAAYRSQTALISRLVRQRAEQHPELFPDFQRAQRPKGGQAAPAQSKVADASAAADEDEEAAGSRGPPILAHTVDVYQGDENDFVIVSLVRSNADYAVGFLKEISRRCVAQSRARCGFWLIGNAACLANKPGHWSALLKAMRDAGCVGSELPLRCPLHPADTQVAAADAASVPKVGAKFCSLPCPLPMHCGLHRCRLPCQPRHSHDRCVVESIVTLPDCGHRASKLCHQSFEELKCRAEVEFAIQACGHTARKECWQPAGQIKCLKACERDLPGCGHRCQQLCWQRCSPENCPDCRVAEAVRAAELEARRQAAQEEARREAKAELEAIKQRMDGCVKRVPLTREGDSASEFLDVEDRVMKFIRAEHSWYPTVTGVEKVLNASLKKKFLNYKSTLMFEPDRCELKFHGTSAEGVEGIITNGFRLPEKAGMYGAGIYFASDSSKSAREIYTKGSNMLLLCEVLLGRSLTVQGATKDTYNFKRMRQEKFDSLFAPRNSRATNGVMNDEFVVFEPAQAYPKYIVHYSAVNGAALLKSLPTTLPEGVTEIQRPQRHEVDPSKPSYVHWSIATSRFLSGLAGHKVSVTRVLVNQNSKLLDKFEKRRPQSAGAAAKAPSVYAFTWVADRGEAESVMKNGFSPASVTSLSFTESIGDLRRLTPRTGSQQMVLLCKLLPRQGNGSRDAPYTVDSADCALPRYAIAFNFTG